MNDDFVPGFLSYNLQINYRNKYLPYKHLPHKQNKYMCVQNKSAKALHFFPRVIEPTYAQIQTARINLFQNGIFQIIFTVLLVSKFSVLEARVESRYYIENEDILIHVLLRNFRQLPFYKKKLPFVWFRKIQSIVNDQLMAIVFKSKLNKKRKKNINFVFIFSY